MIGGTKSSSNHQQLFLGADEIKIESPFLTINLLENQEYSLEDDVLGQILEFFGK